MRLYLALTWASLISCNGQVQVHLLARGPKLRASRAMQDRVLAHDKVEVHFNTAVDDAYPDGKGALDGLHTKDTKTGLFHTSPLQFLNMLIMSCR